MKFKYSLLLNSLLLATVTLIQQNTNPGLLNWQEDNNLAYRSCRVKIRGCRGGTGRRRIMSVSPSQQKDFRNQNYQS